MDFQVYIANLGKYNEGYLVGAWFTPPIDYEEMAEKIGLNDEYEEYAIHDYEAPFEISEYTSISEINHLCELLSEIEGTPLYDALDEIQNEWFESLEELVENKDEIICYPDCDDMEDFAEYYVEESGQLSSVPENLQNFIDYEALGRELETRGSFVVTSHGVFEYIG